MTDSTHLPRANAPRSFDPTSRTCLGRTCLKWGVDGELSTLDLCLVLKRLAQVDSELTRLPQDSVQSCPSIS